MLLRLSITKIEVFFLQHFFASNAEIFAESNDDSGYLKNEMIKIFTILLVTGEYFNYIHQPLLSLTICLAKNIVDVCFVLVNVEVL